MHDLTRVHVAFTGKLQTLTRQQAIALASACGAFPHDRPVATTQLIVAGIIRKPLGQQLKTEKLAYAQENKLPVINEREFLAWCRQQITRRLQNLK